MIRLGFTSTFFPPQIGGLPAVLNLLLPWLAQHEIAVTVAVGTDVPDGWHYRGVTVLRFAEIAAYRRTFFDYLTGGSTTLEELDVACNEAATAITRAFGAERIELIHNYLNFELGQRAAESLGLPVVVTFHTPQYTREEFEQAGASYYARADWLLEQYTRLRPSAVVTATQFALHRWRSRGLICPFMVTIPYPLNGAFRPVSPAYKTTARDTLRIDLSQRVICFVQRPAKPGMDVMLRAAALLREQVPELKLLITGSDTPPVPLAIQTQSLNLGDVVMCRAFQTHEMLLPYAAADAVILPNPVEGFGLPAVEALACGVPVVAPATPLFSEFLGDFPGALLFEPGSVVSLADTLHHALSDPRVLQYASSSASVVRQRYSVDRVGNDHLDLYHTLLEE